MRKSKFFVNSAHLSNHNLKRRNIANTQELNYKKLTAEKLSSQLQSADIILLHLHRRVDVSVQSNTCVGMTEQFAEGLGIETIFNADSRIGMT